MLASNVPSAELIDQSAETRANIILSGDCIRASGEYLLRYGLVLILVWIAGLKFTAHEAEAIRPLIATSPFLSWLYLIFSVRSLSSFIGFMELIIALMISVRPISPKTSALGSALAALMFLTTLSFLISLPGWEPSLGGFPALCPTGGFLAKDIILLGVAIWSLGESLQAINQSLRTSN